MGFLQPHERHGRGAGPSRLIATKPKAVVVHSLDQARAAVDAAAALKAPLTLLSGPGAAGYAGAAWFFEVMRLARAEHPGVEVTAILDCAGQPGRALGALRSGAKVLRLTGNARVRKRVAAIAQAMGARLDDTRYATLDLAGCVDARAAVMEFLKGGAPHPSRRSLALAPRDDAEGLSPTPTRHPEEGRRPVSKDEKRRTKSK